MDKKLKIYISLLAIIIVGVAYVEFTKPKKINWYPSYAAKHKIPYGTYVLYKEMPSFFSNKTIKTIHQPPYIYLIDSLKNATYFFVDDKLNFDEAEFDRILSFVKNGNDVFIATNGVNIDALQIKSKKIFTTSLEEKTYYKLVNKNVDINEYYFDREFLKAYFSEIDTLKTTILGELLIKNKNDSIITKKPNFIKTKYGKGNFYLHTFPQAFTNYNMLLDANYKYVASVLSYLNTNKSNNLILWDAYYKTGKSSIASPMHYILSAKNLKWAYYMALIGVMFFVIFKGKRNQRIIPIMVPLKNQTLAFTRTIANMYYEKSEHKNIATHKINYFLEYIRNQYKLSTLTLNQEFYKKLSVRSNNTQENVIELFKIIDKINTKNSITKEELIALNRAIEKFKAYKDEHRK